MVLLRKRSLVGFIEPCLPSPAKAPPIGSGSIHEIKHDGFRIMARRNGAGVRLITRNGNDFTKRFPLAAAAVAALPGRSCFIDGEAIVCDDKGLAVFELIRRARNHASAGEPMLALLYRCPSQILAVDLKKVEGTQTGDSCTRCSTSAISRRTRCRIILQYIKLQFQGQPGRLRPNC